MRPLLPLLALVLLPSLVAQPVLAQNLDLSEVAAALALPILTEDGPARTDTSITVTNTSSNPVRLGVQVISGDPGDRWTSNSWSCPVSGDETTEFYFRSTGSGSEASFECSVPGATGDSPSGDLNLMRSEGAAAENGIFFVYVAGLDGRPLSNDVLVGEASVVDYAGGYAYQVGAVPFQGADALGQDGNLQFRFDGVEYAQFPSVLSTNFHALSGSPGSGLDAWLVLFTLDGTIQGPGPTARVKIDYYNDDERRRNAAHTFSCFDVVSLDDLGSFSEGSLGSRTGHIRLTPSPVARPDRAHDVQFDGSTDGVRRTPVHGWLITKIHAGYCRPGGVPCVGAGQAAAWAKTLDQSVFSLAPTAGDTAVLNAE